MTDSNDNNTPKIVDNEAMLTMIERMKKHIVIAGFGGSEAGIDHSLRLRAFDSLAKCGPTSS